MIIGLSYDLRDNIPVGQDVPDDTLEEYDSLETVEIIKAALQSKGHPVVKLGGGTEFIDNIRQQKVDIVFNIAEGRGSYRSREAQVPSILEMLDIAYTGSDPQCLAICLDKPVTKKLVAASGIRTPGWLVISSREETGQICWDNLAFPAIIKPAYEGSSKGIRLDSIVNTPEEATRTLLKLLEYYHQPVMLEEFISGDEVTAGIISNSPARILGMMRVLPKNKVDHFVYSVEVKRNYLELVEYECPVLLGQEILDKLANTSLKVFNCLGCRDFARIDFRISSQGIPYFLEINPLPGLGSYSDLVIMAKMMGWNHEGLIGAVLDAALERYPQCVPV